MRTICAYVETEKEVIVELIDIEDTSVDILKEICKKGEFEGWNEDPELDTSLIKWFYLIDNEDVIKRLRSIGWTSPYDVAPFFADTQAAMNAENRLLVYKAFSE